MMTSNFNSVDLILGPPAVAISISRGHPRCKGGWRAGLAPGVIGRSDSRLAPSWAALKGTDAAYDRAFAAQLAALNPAAVFAELGDDAVLLCFCDVSDGCTCHRRIVAEWFEHHLGVIVPELGMARDETEVHTGKRFPWYIPPAEKLAWIEAQLAKTK